MKDDFSITNLTKGKLPGLPFAMMKTKILGSKYNLSLVFVDEKKSQELNKTYREKDKSTNVLSFPYSKKDGEIFICIKVAKTQASDYGKTWQEFVGFLVIHGMLHLKGMQHGSTMEVQEEKFSKIFKC
jgi:probable rRNA maturation factor